MEDASNITFSMIGKEALVHSNRKYLRLFEKRENFSDFSKLTLIII